MASTHLTVHSGGGGDYTTLAAAFAASSDGSGGDYSTVKILDSATYVEKIDFTGKTFLRVTCEAGQNPVISQANLCVDMPSGADYVEVVGADASSKITLSLHASGAGTKHVAVASTVNYRLAFLTFRVQGNSCDGVVHPAHTASAVIEDCDLSHNVNGFRYFLSGAVDNLTLQRSDFSGAPLPNGLMETTRLGLTLDRCVVPAVKLLRAVNEGNGVIAASKWRITNNIFIGTASSNPFLQLWDPLFGDGPNAEVWNNTFIGPSGAGVAIQATGAVELMANLDIRNNGFKDWTTGVTSASDLTISHNGFYGCTNNVGGNAVSTDDQTDDPLLDGDYIQGLGSPWLDTGATIAEVTTDYAGMARPQYGGIGLLYDIGAYEVDYDLPDLVSASADGRNTIHATFDEAVSGADLEDETKWSVTQPDGGDAVTVYSVVCTDGINVVLTVSDMDPDTIYRVTCPATLQDAFGNLMGTTEADFVSDFWQEPESGNPWAVTQDGQSVDLGTGVYEMVPWAASGALVTLRDAVWMSLFSDRRADPDDILPDPMGDIPYKGGWWGDSFAEDGDLFGSRLWLLFGQPITAATPRKVEEYAREALQWMLDKGVAVGIDAVSERFGQDRVSLSLVIYKSDGTQEAIRFPDLWAEYEAA